MTFILFAAVSFSIIISACCSLMEAALYAVPVPFIRYKSKEGSKAAAVLRVFKEDMGKPVSCILIINTIANTAGAAVSGWAAGEVFGSRGIAIFSAFFTLAILYCSEIVPKLIGVIYCREVALFVARPLRFLISCTKPLIWTAEILSSRIKRDSEEVQLSEQEFLSMTALSTEEGALDHFEGSVIANVVGLDRLLVRDVLTPRIVVFKKSVSTPLGEIRDEIHKWAYSRVPLFRDEDHDLLISYVTQRDIYRELIKGRCDRKLSEIARPLATVPELMRADKLLLLMFEKRDHICAVVDEHGGLAGIITLEDIIEEVVGREIIDEYDTVGDLRSFARVLSYTRQKG